MGEIEELGSAVSVLRSHRVKNQALPRDMVLGTLVRFKQLRSGILLVRYTNAFVHALFLVIWYCLHGGFQLDNESSLYDVESVTKGKLTNVSTL